MAEAAAIAGIVSALATVGSTVAGLFGGGKDHAPPPAPPPPLPPIGPTAADLAAESTMALGLKQRRGRAATILAGAQDTGAPAPPSGLKTILGG